MRRNEPLALLVLGLICLVVSRIGALESGTWMLEVFPIFIAVPISSRPRGAFRSRRSRIA